MAETIGERASPNCGPRRGVVAPDMVVLHYTAMDGAEAACERLCDPAAEVSAHYVIAEDGRTWRLVPEILRAWHAGVASWAGERDVNSRSIGIELANPGDAPFAAPQMIALEALLDGILARWRIPPERVVGHECVAPGRKADPGPRFDWRRLALRGLSVWLDAPRAAAGPADALAFQIAARRFGYDAAPSGRWDAPTTAIAQAFRRRFRPWSDDPACAAALAHLEAMAARWPGRTPGDA